MIFAAVVALAVTFTVAVVGSVVVSKGSEATRFARPLRRDESQKVEFAQGRAAFAPMDIGEDPMRWPSEIERRGTRVKLPSWPSTHWDDPQFGQFTKTRGDVLGELKVPRRRAPKPEPRAASQRPEAQRPAARASQRSTGRSAPAKAQPRAKKKAPKVAPTPQASSTGNAPSPAEVRELAQNLGLAGAVQEIRGRTGWDFQKAAQYLAQAMRS